MPTVTVLNPVRLVVVLAALLLATTACSSDGSAEGGFPQQSFGSLPDDIDYVALGDSYSAGPLVTTVRSDPSGCVRSTDNYPAFLAGWLDVESYTDVTCSAADTRDLTGRQRTVDGKRVPPQLDALSAETDLVTVGIGGNDYGIFSSLVGCVDVCSPGLQQRLLRDAGRVEDRIQSVVDAIGERSPDAEIFVVGYPQVLPEDEACGAVPLSPKQLEVAARIADRLNASLLSGAEGADASYVDVGAVSEGHDVCAGEAAWINGPEMKPGIAAPFHPVLEGMRGVAAEVFSQITGDEAPSTERAAPPRDAVVRN